jgi:hypothetical protein
MNVESLSGKERHCNTAGYTSREPFGEGGDVVSVDSIELFTMTFKTPLKDHMMIGTIY